MDQVKKTDYERLEEAKAKGFHLLIPSSIKPSDIVPGWELKIDDDIYLKPHPRDKDVYPDDTTQWDFGRKDWKSEFKTGDERVRPTAQGLRLLARHALMEWSQKRFRDDPRFPRRRSIIQSAGVRTHTGEFYAIPEEEIGMDLDFIKRDLEFQYASKQNKDWLVQRDLHQKENFMNQLLSTKMESRLTRNLLGVNHSYSVRELALPFVTARVIPKFDMTDPYVKRRLTDIGLAALEGIWGLKKQHTEPQPRTEIGEIDDQLCIEHETDIIDLPEHPNGNAHYPIGKDHPPEDAPSFLMAPEPTPAESLRADFLNSDLASQCKVLLAFADQKGFSVMDFLRENKQKTLETLNEKWKVALYDHLAKMPGKGAKP